MVSVHSHIKRNFLYNVSYQILLLILPLITVPYISRILGAEGIGVYSYTYSIAYYFMLFAQLGLNNYGNRSIAKVRNDAQKLSNTFWGIYFVQLVMSVAMLLLYLLYVLIFSPSHSTIAVIQSIYVLSVLFDVNWFFFGIEEFRATTIRGVIIKLLTLVSIFTFVKSGDDLWIYTLTMAVGTLASQLVMWPFLKGRLRRPVLKELEIKKHIKPSLVLFIPVIAVSLYKIMDKVMLGLMAGVVEVGYYEQAEKLVNIPLAAVTALGTVIMPRMSNLAASGKDDKMKDVIAASIYFMMFLAIPSCFGLIAIANDFVPLFMGEEFARSITLLYILAPTLLFVSFANVLRTGYLIPKERDRAFVVFTIIGAVVNLGVNFLLIPRMQSVGACIGTFVAELAVMVCQVIAVKNDLSVWRYLWDALKLLVKGLVMFAVAIAIPYIGLSRMMTVVVQVIVSVAVYFLLNYEYVINLMGVGGKGKKLINIKKEDRR